MLFDDRVIDQVASELGRYVYVLEGNNQVPCGVPEMTLSSGRPYWNTPGMARPTATVAM